MSIGELFGMFIIGYGLWFGARGVKLFFNNDKIWWRHLSRKERYPYPAAGLLIGVVMLFSGTTFMLYHRWPFAKYLGYAGGLVFILVFAVGIWQPSFLHPRWYAKLEEQYGRKEMERLKAAAYQTPIDEWRKIAASQDEFDIWINHNSKNGNKRSRRGYKKQNE